ncbi:UPF0561 protein C2orf68 homolog isoform X3 [Falco cherrug]|uniref:UPF0561 protein C2orf68 homolog isoform X3 n=1 Tax=Falco cherrug TaxID=345164 RepID=UPI0024798BED|nr:UPF0561 protein C2orf68 homolog isoform X3 [Falco cherrug]
MASCGTSAATRSPGTRTSGRCGRRGGGRGAGSPRPPPGPDAPTNRSTGPGGPGVPGETPARPPPPADTRGPRLFCLEYEGDDGHVTSVIVHQGDSAEEVTRRVCAQSPLEPALRRALCQRVQDELSKRRGTG